MALALSACLSWIIWDWLHSLATPLWWIYGVYARLRKTSGKSHCFIWNYWSISEGFIIWGGFSADAKAVVASWLKIMDNTV